MATSDEVDVWIGLDLGNECHVAEVLADGGDTLLTREVDNDEAALDALIAEAARHGSPCLLIDESCRRGRLAVAVSARRGVPVAFVPGLERRRTTDPVTGERKAEARGAHIVANCGRARRDSLHWLDTGDDAVMDELRVLKDFDHLLGEDCTCLTNRLREALIGISPAIERAVRPRLDDAGVRALLMRFPTPTALRDAGRARIEETVRSRSSSEVAVEVADAVTAALRSQTITLPAEVTVGRVVAEVAAELDRVHERRQELEAEMDRSAAQPATLRGGGA